MRNRFDEQLSQLNDEIIAMGTMIEQAIEAAVDALIHQNVEEARRAMECDKDIDHQEREIENLCLKLLLQQQPVAGDLRKISAALKMITDMERIGDQASDIAEIILTGELGGTARRFPIGEMAKATIKMVTASVDAYVKQDLKIAQDVIEYDDVVDKLFDEIREQLVYGIGTGEASGVASLDLLMIAKYYERIGDHATNIAEWVEFSITGQHRGEVQVL